MPLVKKAQAEVSTRSAIVLDLGDLRREAERIKAEAAAQARALIEAGQRRAGQLTEGAEERGYELGLQRGQEEGYRAGLEKGQRQAREEAKQELAELGRRWEQALAQFDAGRDDLLRQAREDVLRLALRLSERVLRTAVQLTPDCAAQQAAKAVEMITEPTRLRLLIHPEDAESVREVLPDLERRAREGANIVLQTSDDVARGGCLLQHGQGEIDATIETQLERIVSRLFPNAAGDGPSPVEDEKA
ncbi:MAG: FliH/SctL family protein [Phycisphaerales bacterium JB038]